ncbi:MAG: FHA domain-containing protein [Granulosicoccus sp.]
MQTSWPVQNTLIIGRELADVVIAVPALSRKHAQVSLAGINCHIKDLNSKNGTAVNGNMLTGEPHPLCHGDTILLAGCVELNFQDSRATPIAPRLGKLRGLWIDPVTDDVWVDAEKLVPPLSAQQFRLLKMLDTNGGSFVSKDDIINTLWPDYPAGIVSNDAVDSLIKRLRKRLASVDHGEPVVDIARGRGIRLMPDR